jgi:hypothetical protein
MKGTNFDLETFLPLSKFLFLKKFKISTKTRKSQVIPETLEKKIEKGGR